jgi:hypothetical protein
VGELFTSFDQAWNHFLGRVDPLEDFFEQFDEDEKAVLEGWVIEPSTPVKCAAAEMQSAISHLGWLVPVPDHFLHVWIGTTDPIGPAWERWPEVDAFSVAYVRANCFHTAVVVEVAGPIRRLVAGTPCDIPAFLPHMTVAIVRGHPGPDELRKALLPLRDSQMGEQIVREVKRVRFPAARTTLLRPWAVEQVVPLR